ncbi:MAG: ribonuclease HI [Gammaproteobacteria bacterium]|nr:ribonuclease HI [Gammaproteobacteria bacterium]MDD9799236.1 ribonuclease HI [Gammaproteobacteria bacterium]MDD9851698.1 ribonuclease HI [Gammaproteobacteria bacterium]MDD9870703.1 ribonuclease HI [Gammaproteobacteria bacterium]
MNRPRVRIYTDGSCLGNPGPGGWGAVLLCGGESREISGGEKNTTNNRMELTAALSALRALQKPCEVDFYTDSQYLKQGITCWLAQWKKRNWRTSARQPVKNADLWRALEGALGGHRVRWHWVRGHAGDRGNERADKLARSAVPRPAAGV